MPWRTINSPASSTCISGSAVITGEEARVGHVVAEVAPVGDHRQREVAVRDEAHGARVVHQHDRADVALAHQLPAISRTVRSGAAVTTDSVMTSLDQHARESG